MNYWGQMYGEQQPWGWGDPYAPQQGYAPLDGTVGGIPMQQYARAIQGGPAQTQPYAPQTGGNLPPMQAGPQMGGNYPAQPLNAPNMGGNLPAQPYNAPAMSGNTPPEQLGQQLNKWGNSAGAGPDIMPRYGAGGHPRAF